MLDPRFIRDHPAAIEAGATARGAVVPLAEFLDADARRRALLRDVEERKARRNRASEAIAAAKRRGEDASAAIAESRGVGDEILGFQGYVSVDAFAEGIAQFIGLDTGTASDGTASALVDNGGLLARLGTEHLERRHPALVRHRERIQPVDPGLSGQFNRRHRSTREMQRGNDSTALLLEFVEVVYCLASARVAHLNALCLQVPPRLL